MFTNQKRTACIILVCSVLTLSILVANLMLWRTHNPAPSTPGQQARTNEAFGKLPLYFIENQGQTDGRVAYYVQGSDKAIYFTDQGLTFILNGMRNETTLQPASLNPHSAPHTPQSERWALKLDFVGAKAGVHPEGEAQTEAIISYFKGHSSKWKRGLKTYSRIVYRDLWPGIDLVYAGTANRMKYTFVVQPGADPNQIKLAYRGASGVTLNAAGQLDVRTPVGGFTDDRPVSFQEVNGKQAEVETAYALDAEGQPGAANYGFALGEYDHNRELVIDPAVLIYAGFIGGSGQEFGNGITVDNGGNAYIVGDTTSTEATFPDGDGFGAVTGPDSTFNGDFDAFVAKVNASGTALVYIGYIGGIGFDRGYGIAVDNGGNAYITGQTSSSGATFPDGDGFGVINGPDTTFNGGFGDAFVAKVNAAGTALVYAGYIGGSGDDVGYDIAVDNAGNAYVTGNTSSTQATFPDGDGFGAVTGPDTAFNGNSDAFVVKVNAAGTALVYAGYIGGSGADFGYGIAMDSADNAYVTGFTGSSEATFPDGDGFGALTGPDTTFNGGQEDAFVVKVNATGTSLVYAGYIGGSDSDIGRGIAVDSSGNVYVTGRTASTEATFPDGDGFGAVTGPDTTYNGGFDAFVAKVNAGGTALAYAGYIGGSGLEFGLGIVVDSAGKAYVTGYTESTEATFPDGDGFGTLMGPDTTFNGGQEDGFVAKVNAPGTALIYAGYIGGSDNDTGRGIALDSAGNVYICGDTLSSGSTFPDGDGFGGLPGPDTTSNGLFDAFVAKISSDCTSLILGAYPNATVIIGGNTTVTPAASPSGAISSITASAPGFTGSFSVNPISGVVTINNAGPFGNYTVTVMVTDNCGATATKTFTLSVNCPGATIVVTTAADTVAVDGGCSLREAIQAANTNTAVNECPAGLAGLDTIYFAIGAGTPTINLTGSALPIITEPVVIDGSFCQSTRVELNGAGITSANTNGLKVTAGNSTIRSLVINRFTGNGLAIQTGNGNVIENCFIGTNVTGALDRGNAGDGILITASSNNRIGGISAGQRNLISGNDQVGIEILTPSNNNIIQGNFIGTDVSGTQALGNVRDGIFLNSSNAGLNLIGGTAAGAGNLISSNGIQTGGTGAGIALFSPGNQVLGNLIGTDITGTLPLGNLDGMRIGNDLNVIGGTLPGAANTIAHSTRYGILAFNGTRNSILSNSIFSNSSLGIDLGQNGVTANDSGDSDVGPNNFQNFPVLMQATSNQILGTLNSVANTTFTVQFFSNLACDSSGNGEGQTYLGQLANVTTNASGNASIIFTPSAALALGTVITATATDPNGNTSEFSGCRVVTLPTLSINDVTVTEGHINPVNAVFTVSLSAPSTQTVTVQYATANGTAIAPGDYTGLSLNTLTFPPNTLTQTITVAVQGDTTFEPNEIYFVNLTSPTNATLADAQGLGTITNDDSQPGISINDVTITEGNSGMINAVFTVSLSNASHQTITVQYATANNTATAPSDYTALPLTTLSFPPNTTTKTITVAVNGDTVAELNESFFVFLSNPTNAGLADNKGVGTITNDDACLPPVANAGPDQTKKSSPFSGLTPITLNGTASSNPGGGTLIYQWREGATVLGSTAILNVNLTSGTHSITLTVTNPCLAQATDTVVINIVDCPTIAITPATLPDGTVGTPYNQTLTATGGIAPYNFSLLFTGLPPGLSFSSAGVITNTPTQAGIYTFAVGVIDAIGCTGAVTYTVTINGPAISISDVTVTEGDSGTVNAVFTVSLSFASPQTVTVQYATADGTATAPSDYTAAALTTLSFPPNTTTKTITVPVKGETTFEPNETFFVNLSNPVNGSVADAQGQGTITNDDSQPTISINDVTVTEGNSGFVNALFTVTLSNASYQTITVQYSTADGTATAPDDYTAQSLITLTFSPGITLKKFPVPVKGDTIFEPTEIFFANLSNNTNATLADGQGVGTITNNDNQPTLSISDATVTEGNSGTINAVFTVSLSNASAQTITVDYATAEDTATAPGDYTALPLTTLTFPPNTLTQTITVAVNGDTIYEPPSETFFVDLTNPVNVVLPDDQGLGTIIDNESQPTISINDVAVTEGDAGTISAVFTVGLSNASYQTITVKYATANGTATAPGDYTALPLATLTFSPGTLTQTITVQVIGDTNYEPPSETFFVNLSSPTNATIADGQGLGTITNDDCPGVTLLTAWGSVGSGNGQFNTPIGVAVDAAGNVYVTEEVNQRIQKFDSNGNFLLKWGNSGSGNGQFHDPLGIAVDAMGNVYVADTENNRIQKFDANGNFLLKWGGGGIGNGQFNQPIDIAVDVVGNVYVADFSNHRIQKFDSNGNFLLKWGSFGSGNGEFNRPSGVAVDTIGNVYAVDRLNYRVEKFDANGNFILKWGNQGVGDGQFSLPERVAVDAMGNVYVSERNSYRIQKFDANGNFLLKWGNSNTFFPPWGVAVDMAGHVYVVDAGDYRMQKFSVPSSPTANAGPDQTLATTGGPIPVMLNGSGSSPSGGPLTYEWRKGMTVLGSGATLNVNLPAGTHTITLVVTDQCGFPAYDTVVIKIGVETPIGGGSVGGSGATANFVSVTAPGVTYFDPIAPGLAGPLLLRTGPLNQPNSIRSAASGYIPVDDLAFDISTTATFSGPVTTCYDASAVTDPAVFANLRVFHNEAGALIDRTILPPDAPPPDFKAKTICARTTTLGKFVVAYNAITAATFSTQQGSPATTRQLATVSDPDQAASTLYLSVTPLTGTGVTIGSPTIAANGAVTASVQADCAATNSTFELNVINDIGASAIATLTINVTANTPPVLSYNSPQTVAAGQGLTITPATGPSDNNPISFIAVLSSGGFTGDIALNPVTGAINLTNASPGGAFTFTIRATDQCGENTDTSFTVNVTCPVITLNPATLPSGMAGQTYNQPLTQMGGVAPITWSVSAGELPEGLNLDSKTGLLSGAPIVFGTFSFTIQAIDINGCSGVQAYSLVINPPCGTLIITPVPLDGMLPNGFVGTNYNQTFTATGGTEPYTFTLDSGSFPNGLNIVGAELTGTPTATGVFNFSIKATDSFGCSGTRAYTVVISGTGLQFYPLAHPVRMVDTRVGATACQTPGSPITGNTSLTVPARGVCDGLTIPANAAAVTGNVTTVGPVAAGFLTIYPSGATRPQASNSNYQTNQTLNNVFTVGLGAGDGAFNVYALSTTNVVVDVTGYFAPPGANGLFFHPLPAPVRLLDSRAGQTACTTPGTPLLAATEFLQQGNAICGIPATALALVGNATTVGPLAQGFLTLFPADATRPLIASGNYQSGQTLNSPFTVGLSPSGQFKIYSLQQTNLVVDVLGYYSADASDTVGIGLLFSPMTPARLLDTRAGQTACFTPGVAIPATTDTPQAARGTCTIPATAQAIVGNATTVSPASGGFLTFWPSNATRPTAATSNFAAGVNFNRHYTVGLGADGAFNIYALTSTHLVVDVSGSFAP